MSWLKIDASGGRLLIAPSALLEIDPDISITIPGVGTGPTPGTISAVPGQETNVPGVPAGHIVIDPRASTGTPRRGDIVILLGRESIGRAEAGIAL